MRILPMICAAALCPAIVPAEAQMRPGLPDVAGRERPNMPDVNPRRMEVDPDAGLYQVQDSFRRWNRAQGSPRILLFWNRELDDETTTRYRQRDRGVSAVAARPGVVVGSYDRISEQERTTGGTHADLHPDDTGELETAFLSAFVRTGAAVIDRAALMRKVSTREDQANRSDQQYVESQALEQGIDYLVEVLPDYRGDSDTGFGFTVKITHLPSSMVKARFRTTARPAPGPERLVAAPGGFERRRDDRVTPDRIAEKLAGETMQALTRN
jgi:hypothetical protein